jgi:beta-phosphoglucomutase
MTHPIKAIIWDLDGVLADSGEAHYLAFKATLPSYGFEFDREDFKAIFGMGNREGLTYLAGHTLDESIMEAIIEEKEDRFRQLIHGNVQPFSGVMDWLEYFQRTELQQAVASSAPQANIDTMMDELGVKQYFDVILSAPECGLPAKPSPAIFLEAANRLSVKPKDCIVLEDSVAGIEAAKAAGMRCIGIASTNHSEKLLKADHVIDSLLSLDKTWFVAPRDGA